MVFLVSLGILIHNLKMLFVRLGSKKYILFYRYFVSTFLFFFAEILDNLCETFLEKNVTTILYLTNSELFGRSTASSQYFLQLASYLGIPVIAWNADNSGLERRVRTLFSKQNNLRQTTVIYFLFFYKFFSLPIAYQLWFSHLHKVCKKHVMQKTVDIKVTSRSIIIFA